MARNQLYPPSVTPGIPTLGEKPNGWIETTFGDVLSIVKRPVMIQNDEEYQLVTAKRSRGGIVPRAKLPGGKILTETQFYIHMGDFLISKRQIIHGACGVVPESLNGAIVSNEYSVLRPKETLLLDFLDYYSHTIYFQQTCFQSSVGVDVEKMIFDLQEWLNYPIYLPPLDEQEKIIKILRTWDKVILLYEKTIKAKQTLKQGLIQKLFSGILRFPEYIFSTKIKHTTIGDYPYNWKIVRICEVAEIFFSNIDKKINVDEVQTRLCNYLDVYNNFFLNNKIKYAHGSARESEIKKFIIQKGDVLITKDSETVEDIAKSAVVSEDLENVICGYHLAILRPLKSEINGIFLMYLLQYSKVHKQFVRLANGVTRYGLAIDAIKHAYISLPSLIEQEKISNLLTALDSEIHLLKIKLTHLRNQEKNLLRQLITGKIRVIG